MSAADEIESLMHRRRAEQQAATQTDEQRRAKILADGAQYARGFIDLMRRSHVRPEPIYAFRQLNARDPRKEVIEEFNHFESAWVIDFTFDPREHESPGTIQCLREDGKTFHCFAHKLVPNGFPTRGLVTNPPKTALASVPGTWVLYLDLYDDSTIAQFSPRDPQYYQGTYARAAGWYL